MAIDRKMSWIGIGGVRPITMHGKYVEGFTYEKGMALALTGENEVGPGEAGGSPVYATVSCVEMDSDTDIVLGVQDTGYATYVTYNPAKAPTVGAAAYCDNLGNLIDGPSTDSTAKGVITAVGNPHEGLATVRF